MTKKSISIKADSGPQNINIEMKEYEERLKAVEDEVHNQNQDLTRIKNMVTETTNTLNGLNKIQVKNGKERELSLSELVVEIHSDTAFVRDINKIH